MKHSEDSSARSNKEKPNESKMEKPKKSRINREEFLHKLQSVQPGLSAKDILEQSSSFIFRNGYLVSYNDELACRCKSGLDKAFQGAVKSKSLLSIMEKLPDDELEIETTDTNFSLLGKRRRVDMNLEKEILLPVDTVETPKDWKPLHKDFCDAVATVQQCAGKNAADFIFTCVHIHPKWVEASDDFQYCRWRLKTGISQPTLVRQSSIKHISSLGMQEFAETENWLHFKNSSGLILSCRRFVEEWQFPSAEALLKTEGTPTQLPKGLAKAADSAQVFSSEVSEDNQVLVELNEGRVKVIGRGTSGKYTESRKAGYKGKSLTFMVPPKLLMTVVEKHTDFFLSDRNLRVNGEQWVYVTVLGQPPSEETSESSPEEAEEKPRKEKKRKHEEEE